MLNFHNKELKKVELLFQDKKFNEALNILDQLQMEPLKLQNDDQIKFYILKGNLLNIKDDYEKGLETLRIGLNLARNKDKILLEFDILICMAEAFWRLSRYDEGLQNIDLCEKLATKFSDLHPSDHDTRMGLLFHRKGSILAYSGKLDDSIQYYNQALNYRNKVGNKSEISATLSNLGIVYLQKGELDIAFQHFQDALKLDLETGIQQNIASSYTNVAIVYAQQGYISKAIELYQKVLTIHKTSGHKRQLGLVFINMGDLYARRGELKLSIDYINKSIPIFKEIGSTYELSHSYYLLGKTYRKNGNYKRGLSSFKQSLELRKKTKNNYHITECLLQLITLAIDKKSYQTANDYLKQLKEINLHEKNKVINLKYRMGKAISLKSGISFEKPSSIKEMYKILGKYVKAQGMLERIINEDIIDHEITIDAIFNLGELLILELKFLGSNDILTEVKALSDKLIQIGEEKNISGLLAKTYMLKSKLALLDRNYPRARILLEKAFKSIEGKGYYSLELTIENIRNQLSENLPYWIIDHNVTLFERLDHLHLDEFFIALKQNRVEHFVLQDEKQRGELIDFVHQMAHDLRNKMSNIMGFSEAIKKQGYKESSVDTIIKNVHRMQELLEHSLSLADAGAVIDKSKSINLTTLVKEVGEETIPENVLFEFEELPVVLCDPVKVKQIIKNLIENAIVHGKTTSKISVRYENIQNEHIISFKNDGIPIPVEIRPRIFQRGFTTRKGNTGLGLAIVKKLVMAHGWRIILDPENDQETVFKIYISI